MASTEITNRNRWTEAEDQALMSFIANSPSNVKAFEAASRKLGRTISACNQRYCVIKGTNQMASLTFSREEIHTLISLAIKQREGLLLEDLVSAIALGLTPQQSNNIKYLMTHYNLMKEAK